MEVHRILLSRGQEWSDRVSVSSLAEGLSRSHLWVWDLFSWSVECVRVFRGLEYPGDCGVGGDGGGGGRRFVGKGVGLWSWDRRTSKNT